MLKLIVSVCIGDKLLFHYLLYSEYLAEKKHLGGLLILLPTKLSVKNGEGNNDDKGQLKSVLAELEKLLVHEEVPVSYTIFRHSCLYLLLGIYMFSYLFNS